MPGIQVGLAERLGRGAHAGLAMDGQERGQPQARQLAQGFQEFGLLPKDDRFAFCSSAHARIYYPTRQGPSLSFFLTYEIS